MKRRRLTELLFGSFSYLRCCHFVQLPKVVCTIIDINEILKKKEQGKNKFYTNIQLFLAIETGLASLQAPHTEYTETHHHHKTEKDSRLLELFWPTCAKSWYFMICESSSLLALLSMSLSYAAKLQYLAQERSPTP